MPWIKLSNQFVNLDAVERITQGRDTDGRLYLTVFLSAFEPFDVRKPEDVEKLASALTDLCADTEESAPEPAWTPEFTRDIAAAQFAVDVHAGIPDETPVRLQMDAGGVLGTITVGDIRRLKEALHG